MDEINRESETDVVTIIISYVLMFLYITIFLGHVRSIKTILVCTCTCIYMYMYMYL